MKSLAGPKGEDKMVRKNGLNYNRLLQFSVLTKKGLYRNQYWCEHVDICANLNQAGNRDLCNHSFGFSISSFDST